MCYELQGATYGLIYFSFKTAKIKQFRFWKHRMPSLILTMQVCTFACISIVLSVGSLTMFSQFWNSKQCQSLPWVISEEQMLPYRFLSTKYWNKVKTDESNLERSMTTHDETVYDDLVYQQGSLQVLNLIEFSPPAHTGTHIWTHAGCQTTIV